MKSAKEGIDCAFVAAIPVSMPWPLLVLGIFPKHHTLVVGCILVQFCAAVYVAARALKNLR